MFFPLVSCFWTACFAFHLFQLLARRCKAPELYESRYHLVAWGIPIAVGVCVGFRRFMVPKLTVAIDCGPFVLAGVGWYRPGRGERAALVLDTIMERQSVERARVLHPACDLLRARSTQLFAQPRDVRDAAVLNGEHRIQKYGVATVCVSHHSCCLVPRSRTTACQQAWRLASVVLQSPEIRRVKDPDYATRGIPSGTSPVTVP
jgi:hypothetical protein